MSRINVIDHDTATDEQRELLDAIQNQLGMVPNFLKVFANSPAALRAFLGLHSIAGEGSLDAQTRERIALAIAQETGCQYCVSAHTAIGRKAGLNGAEIEANHGRKADRRGTSGHRRSTLRRAGARTTGPRGRARSSAWWADDRRTPRVSRPGRG